MLITPHVLAGAALGSLVTQSPAGCVIGFMMGWGSHYLLDALPHWERLFGPHDNLDLRKKPFHAWPQHIYVQAFVDTLIGFLAMMWLVYQKADVYFVWQSPMFWAGLGGAFPDIVDNIPTWQNVTKHVPFWRAVERLHRSVHIPAQRQRKMPKYTGLATQIIVVIIAAGVLDS